MTLSSMRLMIIRKREVEDYRFAVENDDRDEAIVVDCLWELEDDDLAAITDVFGKKVLEGRNYRRLTYYGVRQHKSLLKADSSAARKHPGQQFQFP